MKAVEDKENIFKRSRTLKRFFLLLTIHNLKNLRNHRPL